MHHGPVVRSKIAFLKKIADTEMLERLARPQTGRAYYAAASTKRTGRKRFASA